MAADDDGANTNCRWSEYKFGCYQLYFSAIVIDRRLLNAPDTQCEYKSQHNVHLHKTARRRNEDADPKLNERKKEKRRNELVIDYLIIFAQNDNDKTKGDF